MYTTTCIVKISVNHNSLGCEQPPGLDVNQSQDVFLPIPGLIRCAGVTGSVGITRHAHATHMASLSLHRCWHVYIHVQYDRHVCTLYMYVFLSCGRVLYMYVYTLWCRIERRAQSGQRSVQFTRSEQPHDTDHRVRTEWAFTYTSNLEM